MHDIGEPYKTVMVNEFDESVAKNIVEKIAETLRGELLDVVVGKKWIKGHYPKW